MEARLTRGEQAFVRSRDTCRMATVGEEGWPHNVPVGYLYKKGLFYIPPSRISKKASNIRANDRTCIVIDADPQEKGLMIQGQAEIARGKRSKELKSWMSSETGWTIGQDSVIVVLRPTRKASWGI